MPTPEAPSAIGYGLGQEVLELFRQQVLEWLGDAVSWDIGNCLDATDGGSDDQHGTATVDLGTQQVDAAYVKARFHASDLQGYAVRLARDARNAWLVDDLA